MNIRTQRNTFQFEEDPFSKNAEVFSKIFHEVVILMKFLQTKPQVSEWLINNMVCILRWLKVEMIKKL